MNAGVVRYVSKYNTQNRAKEISILMTTVLRVIVIASAVLLLFGMFYAKKIAGFILGDVKLYGFLIIVLIGLPFFVLYNFYRSFFRGLLKINYYVTVGILSSVAGLLILFPLVYAFKLYGAIWHLTFYAVLSFIIAYYFYKKLSANHVNILATTERFDSEIFKEIAKFGLASLLAGSSTLVALLLVRTLIITNSGFHHQGIYQAVFAISAMSIQVIIEAIGTYSFPTISGLTLIPEVRKEINKTFRLALFLATASIFGLLIVKDFVVLLLFSSEFLPATQILGLQLFGDFFKVIGWSMGVALLPLKRLKAFVAIDVIWSVLFVSIAYKLIPIFGLKGAVLAYLFSYLFHAAANYLYLRKTIGFGLLTKNFRLLVSSAVLLAFVVFFFEPSLQGYFLAGLLFMMWVVFTVTREEFKTINHSLRMIKNKLFSK